ncbi:hypothetical protein EDB81DRAFT_642259, partial [Dactylonectria macrodidyma]
WNPSVESQAIGRVSRLGQDKAVTVTRYLVRGTVEVVRYVLSLTIIQPVPLTSTLRKCTPNRSERSNLQN